MPPSESALVILVPEAEALVKPFRDRPELGTPLGMPAHITLLYPFCPPHEFGPSHLDGLRELFIGFASIRFRLQRPGRFPGVLYLAPERNSPFRTLTKAIWQRFPGFPPYGGRFADPKPHLTVAEHEDEEVIDRVAKELKAACEGKLPVHAAAAQAHLMDNTSGRWRLVETFPLGPSP